MTRRIIRTYYRAVDSDGNVLAESRDPREVTHKTRNRPVLFQRSHTYEEDGPWEPWTPKEQA